LAAEERLSLYEAYWQLDRRPFENSSDPRFYYPCESHQGAMLKLRYAVENRCGGALLCGPSGSGKTLLVQQLKRHLGKLAQPFVHLVFPQMPAESILAYLADELAATSTEGSMRGAMDQIADWPIQAPPRRSVEQTIRSIQQFFAQNSAEAQHAVIAIDEAHLLDDTRTLEALRLLLNFESDSQAGLTLLLIGQPGLLPQIDRMPALEERLGVKCLLRPFTVDEIAAYVNFRLQAAGAKDQIFEPSAMETLRELSHGMARQINRLCDLALLVGYAEERKTINADLLEAVAQELITVSPE
jgi:type II secretory pathway predicted ATPase ExeA